LSKKIKKTYISNSVSCEGQVDANNVENMDDELINGKNFSHVQVQNNDPDFFFLNDERINKISTNL
jgi:hypothetical protein